MDEALTLTGQVLEVLEDTAVLPAIGGREHSETLHDGSLRGLVLQRDTVILVQREIDAAMAAGAGASSVVDDKGRVVPTAAIDVKLLRAGNEAARMLTTLAVRVAEGAFKAQQGSQLVQLLEALKAAQEKKRG